MKKKNILPRPAQIAELTRDRTFPLDPISDTHLLIVADVLARAWHELMTTHAVALTTGDEAELNELMRCRLNDLLEVDSIWGSLVRNVVRGAETTNYDGSHLEKRPDLSIYLTNRNPSYQLVVECKLIDPARGKTIRLYNKDGLARFIRGEYAWATREAFMLAYVRDGSVVATCLNPFLEKHMQGGSDPYHTEDLPALVGSRTNLARSKHTRTFTYLHQQPPASPGPISVWHLWL